MAKSKNRKNIQPVDVFKSLEKGEFEEFLPRLKEELNCKHIHETLSSSHKTLQTLTFALNYIIISLVFQAGQRNKKFDKVIQSVDEGELSVPAASTVINSPPGNGVIVEIPSHNGITNDLFNSDNNETETDIDSEGIRKRKQYKRSKRLREVVSVSIENNSNNISSQSETNINGLREKESDEIENNIKKNDLLDDGSDLTSNIDSSNDEGINEAE
jgi:hypothetical protein